MTGETRTFSINELRFYFTRAAVGVGAPFAIGEEFFESVIWLARHGIDPTDIAAAALTAIDAEQSCMTCDLAGAAAGMQLSAGDSRPLSGLFAGPALADLMVVQAASGEPIALNCTLVDQPALVVASLGARGVAAPISVSWREANGQGRSIRMDQQGISADLQTMSAGLEGATDLSIRVADQAAPEHPVIQPQDLRLGVQLSQAGWSVIYDHFRKCLVPSSQFSREQGAGAGLQDND